MNIVQNLLNSMQPTRNRSTTTRLSFGLMVNVWIFTTALATWLPTGLSAQPNCQTVPASEVQEVTSRSLFDLFGQSHAEPLRIGLMTDLGTLLSDRRNDEYQPASLSLTDPFGSVTNWKARVKMRGRFRRMNCDFPPLKLDLDKDDLRAAGLAPFDQFKLVTHCLDDETSRQVVLREYLAYAMYRALTGQSFRTRLVEVRYTDVSGTYDGFTRLGFLIEDIDELAARLGGEEFEIMNLPDDSFDPYQRMMQSLFQFMVANTDWDLVMARNVKFIKQPFSEEVLAIPYDFDFSGLVNAPYAIPGPNIGLASLTARVFKGPRETEAVVRATIAHYQAKKSDLLRVIDELESLDRESRSHARQMIQSFYRILENETLVKRLFVSPDEGGRVDN